MTIIDNMHRRRLALRTAFPAIVAVVALLIAWVTPAMAFGTWVPFADVPSVGAGVEGMSVGVESAYIVAAYGFDPGLGDTNTTRVYSMAGDVWSIGSAAPLPGRSEGIGVYRQGHVYSIGGRDSIAGVVLDNFERYWTNGDTWVTLPPMPTARAGLGGAVSGQYIYAIGGRTGLSPCTGTALATVERYRVAPPGWVTMAPLPAARSDLAALAMGNKIYVFGGCDASNSVVGDVFIYTIAGPNANTWITAPFGMPTPRAALYQVGFAGTKIYVMGGGVNPGFPGLAPSLLRTRCSAAPRPSRRYAVDGRHPDDDASW